MVYGGVVISIIPENGCFALYFYEKLLLYHILSK